MKTMLNIWLPVSRPRKYRRWMSVWSSPLRNFIEERRSGSIWRFVTRMIWKSQLAEMIDDERRMSESEKKMNYQIVWLLKLIILETCWAKSCWRKHVFSLIYSMHTNNIQKIKIVRSSRDVTYEKRLENVFDLPSMSLLSDLVCNAVFNTRNVHSRLSCRNKSR